MDPIDERLTRAGAAWRDAQPPMVLPAAVPVAAVRPRWGSMRSLAPLVGILAVVLVAVGVLTAVSPRDVVNLSASPSPRPITLLTATDLGTGCQLSWNGGTLVRDERSGLGVRSPDGSVHPVRWPAGFSAYEQAGRAVLVDADGVPMAVDGDVVGYGDGGTSAGIMTACGPSLDSTRTAIWSAGPPNVTRPLTTDELVAIAADPDAVGMTVVAETEIIDPSTLGATDAQRWTGWIDEGDPMVMIQADRSVADLLPDRSTQRGTFAFTVLTRMLLLLGPVALPEEGLTWDVTTIERSGTGVVPVGSLVAVEGWLRRYAVRCLASGPGPSPDPELPFSGCPATGIAGRPDDAGQVGDPLGITVQNAAWDRYGVIPGLDVTLPRHGTWLLRRVANPDRSEPLTGWSVVAKLPELTSASDTVPLPTLVPVASGAGGCRGIGLDATLAGDPDDPRIAWLVDRSTDARVDVVWPAGFRARFSPGIEILDPTGSVVLHAGDPVTGGCTTGPDAAGPKLIDPRDGPQSPPLVAPGT